MAIFTSQTVQQLIEFWWLGPLLVWSIIWKGFGLWHAARHRHRSWFIAILVLNTMGILELIYLFFVIRIQDGSSRE